MTATEVVALWRERDSRYRKRRQPLTDAEVETIRAWRLGELDYVDASERAIAYGLLIQWTPPQALR